MVLAEDWSVLLKGVDEEVITQSMLPQNSALAVADLSTKTEATLAAGPPVSGVTAEEFVHHYEDRMLANRTERTRMWGK